VPLPPSGHRLDPMPGEKPKRSPSEELLLLEEEAARWDHGSSSGKRGRLYDMARRFLERLPFSWQVFGSLDDSSKAHQQ